MRDGVRLSPEVLREALRVLWDTPVCRPDSSPAEWSPPPPPGAPADRPPCAAEVSLVWRDDTSSVREVVPRLHEGRKRTKAWRSRGVEP